MKRREFVNWVGLGVLASSLPVAIAACQPSPPASDTGSSPAETEPEIDDAPREDGFAAVGTVAELDEAGFIADKNFQGSQVVIIRDPTNEAALLAVDSLCTHQGCNVDWDTEGSVFSCGCHGSQFNTDGSVAQGPAAAPLGVFEAKIEGDLVLVKVT
ncbi:MAG: ubiquinol-cytochrome c reductase iron-sulfur subunit [Leptolyngbya sp. SIO1D8]|nr:ubiquinol-cytochrome c reductase iron-sulfur subunit [Leptolyngbya sp. SIO1D8]